MVLRMSGITFTPVQTGSAQVSNSPQLSGVGDSGRFQSVPTMCVSVLGLMSQSTTNQVVSNNTPSLPVLRARGLQSASAGLAPSGGLCQLLGVPGFLGLWLRPPNLCPQGHMAFLCPCIFSPYKDTCH